MARVCDLPSVILIRALSKKKPKIKIFDLNS